MTPTQPEPTLETPARPLRDRPTPGLGALLLGREEEELVLQTLRDGNLFRYGYSLPPEEQGAMCGALEREFREMLGVRHALAVTSGTAALEVALGALGVGPGDEVILAAWSWISCFTAVVRLGALPVLAEIDDTFCLAPGEITRLANPRTKAVIVVHYQGVAADMEPLMAEARAAGIRVLEDCAESPGALYRGRRIGSIGDISIFSFQFQKTITSGEGGLVATDDPVLYERAVRMHDIGQVRPFHQQFITPAEPMFCGSQFRMAELTGAVALAQFRKLDTIRDRCRAINRRILDGIRSLPGLAFRRIPDPEGDSGFEIYFLLQTPELAAEFTRRLDQKNVPCQKMTGTYCHYNREYCTKGLAHSAGASPFSKFSEWPAAGYRAQDFPETENLIHRFVAVPLGVAYTEEDADYIAESIREVHRELF